MPGASCTMYPEAPMDEQGSKEPRPKLGCTQAGCVLHSVEVGTRSILRLLFLLSTCRKDIFFRTTLPPDTPLENMRYAPLGEEDGYIRMRWWD